MILIEFMRLCAYIARGVLAISALWDKTSLRPLVRFDKFDSVFGSAHHRVAPALWHFTQRLLRDFERHRNER